MLASQRVLGIAGSLLRFLVMRNRRRVRPRSVVLPLAMTAAVALAMIGGCGIKGPLKLPPPAPASPSSGATPSPSGATPSPREAPTPAPEALPAEPPAVPAQPTEPRKP